MDHAIPFQCSINGWLAVGVVLCVADRGAVERRAARDGTEKGAGRAHSGDAPHDRPGDAVPSLDQRLLRVPPS